jgi:hypothetical protein
VTVATSPSEPFLPTLKPSAVPQVAFCTHKNVSPRVTTRSMTPWDRADVGTTPPGGGGDDHQLASVHDEREAMEVIRSPCRCPG